MRIVVALLLSVSLLGPFTGEARAQAAYVADALNHAADANGLRRGFLWCLAERESGYDPSAYSGYEGLMQFDPVTWRSQSPRYGFGGHSPYHAWAATHVAAGMIRDMGQTRALYRQWPPARFCGSIYGG